MLSVCHTFQCSACEMSETYHRLSASGNGSKGMRSDFRFFSASIWRHLNQALCRLARPSAISPGSPSLSSTRSVHYRPQEIPRTRSWPAASNLQPLQYARGAMAHEAQSHHPPPGRIRRTIAAEAQTQQRGDPLSSDILLTAHPRSLCCTELPATGQQEEAFRNERHQKLSVFWAQMLCRATHAILPACMAHSVQADTSLAIQESLGSPVGHAQHSMRGLQR